MSKEYSGFYPRIALTGPGGTGALDELDGAELDDKDGAFVVLKDSGVYVYVLDETSGLTEDSPRRIVPNDNPSTKVWILQFFMSKPKTYSLTIATTTFAYGDGDVFFVDPNGDNRNFNPTGTFPAGFKCWVVNMADAPEVITFDSAGLATDILVGQTGIFVCDENDIWH